MKYEVSKFIIHIAIDFIWTGIIFL